ncbi:glycoside hydrolase family 32 protein [Jeotgalibacillus proteolyticus]|uniref:Glycoside hydrolase n=1 Tax=Jeotgalibacillus proteolyticus TaxID=2082395 RepID=A0A2S5GF87_9BACL|nr:glycoside hydrolase family 32 protein [Jeotgalibacillus proteolyticus]PPA71707.1 glycoside hydrolase [Jeotgalibacillus proteolyticus]
MVINSVEKYKPKLHFAPKQHWLNDPNGLVYFEGEYHLFYQYHPNGSTWGPMHWGHAVSKDLIQWEELDIALYPDENGTIFSGSAIVDWHNSTGFFPEEPGIVAIFTHHLDKKDGSAPVQTQSLAYSRDKGRSWEKYKENPVLAHESKVDFRDPKVFWHHETNKWIMVLATGQTITFYSSANLIDWQFRSEFGEGKGSHAGVWECPDLFILKDENSSEEKWVLLVSIGDDVELEMGSRTQYFTGSFDGNTFITDQVSVKWLDYGKDNYAGVSFSDIPKEDGRRIYLGWMNNWRYANQIPTDGWRGQMTLPRELTLRTIDGESFVIQKFVKEVDSFLTEKIPLIEKIQKGSKKVVVSQGPIELDIKIERMESKLFAITVHHTKEQSTEITFDAVKNQIILDRKRSGAIDFSEMFAHEQLIDTKLTDSINLRLLLDSSSIELLVNEGAYSLTSLVYPDQICSELTISSPEGTIKVQGYLSSLKK